MIAKLGRIAGKSAYVLRTYGWRDLCARVLRKLTPSWKKSFGAESMQFAADFDCTPHDLQRSATVMAAHRGPLGVRSINWFLPHFDHVYYGGMHTIVRFAAGFAQAHGCTNRFVVMGDLGLTPDHVYAERIAAAFPALRSVSVSVLRSERDLAAVPAADVSIATYWTTAYHVLKYQQTQRKCYFLQDFEPMFYPAGSTSAQVEATYRFGFYGIANTITLKQIYEQQYQGRSTYFTPCVDTRLFHPAAEPVSASAFPAYTVFFYARPDYWRNGFELGAAALRILKQRLGARVRIVSAGQPWKPSAYGLGGVVESLGFLSYAETAALYRQCDAGLAMMFTRHPSYLPFELMASGCLVVSNINSATAWLLTDQENCLLALPTASCIADALARGLHDQALRQRIAANALQMIRQRFSDWDRQIEQVYRYVCDPEAADTNVG